MKIGCIVQARTTSSRLPGKVLKTLDYDNNFTILESVVSRLRSAERIDTVIIATTVNATDDVIEDLCKEKGIICFRGSENDVLERYYLAATENELTDVIRVTSDCPFIDPYVIDDLIQLYTEGGYEYASNCVHRTYPHGLDCEIFGYEQLKWMHENTTDPFYREHVTSYITSHYDDFKVGSLETSPDYSKIRITVDTEQDYALACMLQLLMQDAGEGYSYRAVLNCYEKYPFLSLINKNILQKKQYETEADELRAAIGILKLQELKRAAEILEERIDY